MMQIEKTIIGKLIALENTKYVEEGVGIIQEAKLGVKLKALKSIDEVSYGTLSKRYLEAAKSNSKKPSEILESLKK